MKTNTNGPGDGKKEKNAGVRNPSSQINSIVDSIKKDYPNYTVTPIKGKANKYSLTDKSGHSVTLSRGPKSNKKTYTTKEALKAKYNK